MEATVKMLLAVKPDTVYAKDQHGATAFHYAVNNNTGHGANIKAIRLLVHANQLPDTLIARNDLGVTALGEAMEPHQFVTDGLGRLAEILEILLENGADARACDGVSRNALHKLSSFSWQGSISPSMIDRLLDLLDVNESDDNGCTALHYLVKNLDQVDAVRHLVSQGADVNAVDRNGNTPLHEVMKGTLLRRMDEHGNSAPILERLKQARDEIIRILLDAGASEDLSNIAGETPKQVLVGVMERRTRQLAVMRAGRGRGRGRGIP